MLPGGPSPSPIVGGEQPPPPGVTGMPWAFAWAAGARIEATATTRAAPMVRFWRMTQRSPVAIREEPAHEVGLDQFGRLGGYGAGSEHPEAFETGRLLDGFPGRHLAGEDVGQAPLVVEPEVLVALGAPQVGREEDDPLADLG